MVGKRSREVSCLPTADPTSASSVSLSDSGDEATHPLKINALSVDPKRHQVAMQCSLPPHRDAIDFPSIDAFEVHYAKEHSSRCSSCGKNFPSPHFLTLHLDEHHNPLREELEAKGEKTYRCFVQDCEKLCSNPPKRRLHLIDKHAFPPVYNFRVVATGIDKTTSMLRESANRRRVSTTISPADGVMKHRRRSSLHVPLQHALAESTPPSTSPSTLTSAPDGHHVGMADLNEAPDPVGNLEQSLAALRFVPSSVTRRQSRKPGK